MAPASLSRQQTEEALDAAEPLPVSAGSARITSPALAEQTGANRNLMHYDFGPIEKLQARASEHYGAGRLMDLESAGPNEIATAIGAEFGRDIDYRPVGTEDAAIAVARSAELL
jgi:hypothetical protein